MFIRFLDRKDAGAIIKRSTDFKIRNHGSFVLWVSFAFIIVTLGMVLHVNKVIYGSTNNATSVPTSEIIMSVIFMITVTLLLSGYVFLIIFKLRALITAVEFQNAIFSSGLKAHSLFCFVVNTDHTVIYADNSSMNIFSEDKVHNLDDILGHEGISVEDKGKLLKAITDSVFAEGEITYKEKSGTKKTVKIVVDPIEKPRGYFIVRGF
jgi:hypothetical protein